VRCHRTRSARRRCRTPSETKGRPAPENTRKGVGGEKRAWHIGIGARPVPEIQEGRGCWRAAPESTQEGSLPKAGWDKAASRLGIPRGEGQRGR
jgi:hypothetical protein